MAVVFEAEELALRRRVALKIFHPRFESGASAMERFLREAEAASRLTHPAVVRVYSRGLSGGLPYIATELVAGARDLESLWQEWVSEPSSLPDDHVRTVAAWFADLAEALTEAHERGVLHRDLKPANFLLDSEGRIHLVDFGLAWMNDRLALSRTGEMSGTPFYMCPEQVRSGSFSQDGACDIYSLGASLYQMLCLRRPVEGQNAEQVFHSILSGEPVPAQKARPSLPTDLAHICMKAIEKDPRQRYASMAEFAADLRCFLRYEPVQAQAPHWARRLQRWVRRHPRRVATALTVTTAAVLWGGVSSLLSGAETHVQAAESRWTEERLQKHGILLRAAQRAVDGYRFADARELFALTEAELQGWAWRHLQERMAGHLATLKMPGGPRVLSADVHPEGKFLVAGFGDGSLQLWRPLTGEGSRELDRFAHGVYAVAFSPDGHWIAAAGDDGEVRLYDTESLKPVQSYFGHEFGVGWVCFAADSASFISIDDGGHVHRVDLSRGVVIQEHQVAPRAIVAAPSPDGSEFAVADGHGGVRRFSLVSGEELAEIPSLHREPVFDLHYLAEDQLLTASLDGGVAAWTWEPGDELAARSWHWQGESPVQSLDWLVEQRQLLLGCKDGSVQRLDLRSDGPPLWCSAWPAHFAFTNALASDPRGRFIATGGDDGAIQLWSADVASSLPDRVVATAIRDAHPWGEQGFAIQLADGTWRYCETPQAEFFAGPVDLPIQAKPGFAEAKHASESLVATAGYRAGVSVATAVGRAPLLQLATDDVRVLALRFVEDQDLLVGVREDGVLQSWGTGRTPRARR